MPLRAHGHRSRTGARGYRPAVKEPTTAIAYERFAALEAHGESPIYEQWALEVAGSPQVLALVEELPVPKRQPNLVLAAARSTGLREGMDPTTWLIDHWPSVRAVALVRSTQTNEPGRCCALVAALAGIREPVALLEVGASAGLCLFPDRYRYRFRAEDGRVSEIGPDSAVVLGCDWLGDAPPPETVPRVAWRAGVDVNPLDATDDADAAWLEQLVWPEQEHRRTRLRAAIAQLREAPPLLVRSDAVEGLDAAAALAPPEVRLVVVHSAVLAYLPQAARDAFVAAVRRLDAIWISLEGPRVLPEIAARLPGVEAGRDFIVARDGVPVGLAGPHGQRYRPLTPGGTMTA